MILGIFWLSDQLKANISIKINVALRKGKESMKERSKRWKAKCLKERRVEEENNIGDEIGLKKKTEIEKVRCKKEVCKGIRNYSCNTLAMQNKTRFTSEMSLSFIS